MKINHETIYFDSSGKVSDSFAVNSSIAIDIAKFNNFSSNRKQRRACQSSAVRDLLDRSLQKLIDENHADLWTLNKMESGKPFLSGEDSPSISLTHSGDWCACAITMSSMVGVDVEVIESRDWEVYCSDIFHPEEAQWVLEAVGHERDIRGLICWCRKEAVVKALGLGLSVSLSEIGFSPEGDLIEFPQMLGEPLNWKFSSKVVCEEVVVAVAWKS